MKVQEASNKNLNQKKWSTTHRLWHVGNALSIIALVFTIILSDQLWNFHVPIGIALTFFFLWRIGLFLFRNDREFLTSGLKLTNEAISELHRSNRMNRKLIQLSHKIGVKASYAGFYLVLAIQIVTGLMLAILGITRESGSSFVHFVKEIHEVGTLLIGIFALLHFVGVIFAELTDEPGIVSDMINGGKIDN